MCVRRTGIKKRWLGRPQGSRHTTLITEAETYTSNTSTKTRSRHAKTPCLGGTQTIPLIPQLQPCLSIAPPLPLVSRLTQGPEPNLAHNSPPLLFSPFCLPSECMSSSRHLRHVINKYVCTEIFRHPASNPFNENHGSHAFQAQHMTILSNAGANAT